MPATDHLAGLASAVHSTAAFCKEYVKPLLGIYGWRVERLGRPQLVPRYLADHFQHLSFCVFAAQQHALETPGNLVQAICDLPPPKEGEIIIAYEDLPPSLNGRVFDDLRIAEGPEELPDDFFEPLQYVEAAEAHAALIAAAGAQFLDASARFFAAEKEIYWHTAAGQRLKELLMTLQEPCEESLLLLAKGLDFYPSAAIGSISGLNTRAQKVAFQLPQFLQLADQLGQRRIVENAVAGLHQDLQFWCGNFAALYFRCREFCEWFEGDHFEDPNLEDEDLLC